jgi:hypothetical protein
MSDPELGTTNNVNKPLVNIMTQMLVYVNHKEDKKGQGSLLFD